MKRQIPSKEQVLKAAKVCPQAKEVLEILYPSDFPEMIKLEERKLYKRIGDSIYRDHYFIALPRKPGDMLDLWNLTQPGWWGACNDSVSGANFVQVDGLPNNG